jgi:hypothetical protein
MHTTEALEQKAVVEYIENRGWLFSATLGGAFFNGNFGIIKKLHREGWRRGVPDLIIFIKRKAGDTVLVFLEMKKNAKGKTTEEQDLWLAEAEKVQGCTGIVGYGAIDAIQKLDDIFNS